MNAVANNKHPEGLFVLFFTEMWERFSYYGMRAILVLYVTKALLMPDDYANDDVYGSYTGLVYLTPLLGGYFADRIWGNRRCIITGGFIMALGQFVLFISASLYDNPTLAHSLMWVGLAGLIIGNGFFKPNISTMVGQLYPANDKRLDAAYTIFYMGINLGATIGPLICGGLAEQNDASGAAIQSAFKWGFLAACFAMIIGTLSFIWLKNKYVIDPNGAGLGIYPNKSRELDRPRESTKSSFANVGLWALIAVGIIMAFKFLMGLDWIGAFIFGVAISVCGLIITDASLTPMERARVIVIYISAFFVIFFWAAFEQAGSSLTLFADRNVNRVVNINTQLGTVILFVLGVAALLYYILQRIMNVPKELKMIFGGMALIAIAYALYHYIQGTPYVRPDIPASWFNSVNGMWILILAPILSQVWVMMSRARIEPSSPKKQSLGLLMLALGYLVIAIGVKDVTGKVSMLWLITMYFLHTVGELCLSPIGLSLVNKLAPARFASLLMGVWFLSNATANKFGGTLAALIPSQGPTQILGYQINTLYDFFMVFVVMSGIAAALLFVLTFWMEKQMVTRSNAHNS